MGFAATLDTHHGKPNPEHCKQEAINDRSRPLYFFTSKKRRGFAGFGFLVFESRVL